MRSNSPQIIHTPFVAWYKPHRILTIWLPCSQQKNFASKLRAGKRAVVISVGLSSRIAVIWQWSSCSTDQQETNHVAKMLLISSRKTPGSLEMLVKAVVQLLIMRKLMKTFYHSFEFRVHSRNEVSSSSIRAIVRTSVHFFRKKEEQITLNNCTQRDTVIGWPRHVNTSKCLASIYRGWIFHTSHRVCQECIRITKSWFLWSRRIRMWQEHVEKKELSFRTHDYLLV